MTPHFPLPGSLPAAGRHADERKTFFLGKRRFCNRPWPEPLPCFSIPVMRSTLPEVLARRAVHSPHKVAFSFLADGETLDETVTFSELHQRVASLARHLVASTRPNDRVLLLYPAGIDYVVAVLGCLYAGRIAVPAYPPKLRRPDPRFAAIVADCAPGITLTDAETAARLPSYDDAVVRALPPVVSWSGRRADSAEPAPVLPLPALSDVALLQYTSGSTANPKGVVLTHGNLVANIAAIQSQFDLHEDAVALSWLPPYHDMGLIGFIFGALYLGCHLVLMPPASFVQRPLRWLQAIDRFRVSISGAPNFGYEQCLRKISPAERAALDLRSWKRALNGAEPVSAATLQEFARAFSVAGFDAGALTPCYGLAEATLLVSGKPAATAPVIAAFDDAALAAHEARAPAGDADSGGCRLVSSGRVAAGTTVLIVGAESTEPLPDGRIGEICISGDGVTRGYWNAEARAAELFFERDGRTFLRTGDLGFLREGELFVTGRIKDLIILRGRNHYPQDIEHTAGHAHALLQPGAAAAFSVAIDGAEQLVVAVEVTRAFRTGDEAAVTASITEAIATQHGIVAHAVALLRPAHLPRTSSGKVRRSACRQMWLEGALPLAVEGAAAPAATTARAPAPVPARNARSAATADALIAWLREYGATRINSRVIDERRTIPPYVVLDFGNRGLMGLQVAETFGGLDLSHVDALRVMEQVAAIDLTLASLLGVHQALGTRPIKHFASAARQRELLPAIATGRELAAFALTEPAAGSNPLALQTRAVPQPDGGWKLYGQKEWIGLASWAGVITVFAQLYDTANRPRGITAFVVRQGAPGLRHGPEALTMGVRGMVQNRLFLEGVPVSAADMLGQPGDGMAVAQDAMMFGRLGLGVMSLAAMKRSAQLMLQYASARTISTGRLLDNPVTLTRLNTLTSAIDATDALVYTIARWLDEGLPVPPALFMAVKITAPELLGHAVDDLVQLLGGRGYIEPNLVPQLLRDARLIRIFEGPTETLTMALGTYLTRDATGLLQFVASHLPRGDVATRMRGLLARCNPHGRSLHGWTIYQLGDYAAYALMLAAAHQHAGTDQSTDTVRWLERLLADKEAMLAARSFQDIAPASANDLSARIAHYAGTIGNVTQTLAGEDHQPDPLLYGVPQSPPPVAVVPKAAEVGGTPAVAQDTGPVDQALRLYLSKLLKVPPGDIDGNRPLVQYGLDSLALVELQFHVERTFGYTVSAEAFFDQLTLNGLTSRIAAAGTGPLLAADEPFVGAAASASVAAEPEASPIVPVVSRASDVVRAAPAEPARRPAGGMDFSLFFFSDNAAGHRENPYQLLLDAARYADTAGFAAVWVPERHFHPFGGLYPNPSVVAAALSMVTRNVRLRAGSVVLPLHHPARVAEEWAVVDNLSGGRVDLAFTPGWSVNDFALAQERYATRLDSMFESLRTFEALWRGEAGSFTNGVGEPVELSVFPRPHHAERTVWLTCTRGRERFEKAGELGANVLTALLMQTSEELADNIAAYRASRARHGFDPATGVVTLMLHTYLGKDLAAVRELVREPLHEYLVSSIQLWGMTERSLEQLAPAERSRVIEAALERYIRTSSLIGTPETAAGMVEHLQRLGVNEIACLIDFGVDDAHTLEGLRMIGRLRDHHNANRAAPPQALAPVSEMLHTGDPAVAEAPLPFF